VRLINSAVVVFLQQRFPGRLKRDRILLEGTQKQRPEEEEAKTDQNGNQQGRPIYTQSSVDEIDHCNSMLPDCVLREQAKHCSF